MFQKTVLAVHTLNISHYASLSDEPEAERDTYVHIHTGTSTENPIISICTNTISTPSDPDYSTIKYTDTSSSDFGSEQQITHLVHPEQ